MSEEKQETTEEQPEAINETPETPNVPSLYHNYISFAGTAIAIAGLASIILLFLIEITSGEDSPYLGILTFIILPGVLVFGLFLILIGILYERRRRRTLTPEQIAAFPILDLNNPRRRRTFVVFLVLSFLFLFMSAFGSYRAYEFSESVTFCGQTCHTVMKPEFVAYNASPHAKVRCVECHVGGGAEWYVRAKLNGMRQLYGVIANSYSKPIETPVHNMRPARDTCAACHWAEKFYGEQLRVFNHYQYDEQNSLNQTRMLVNVGGGSPETGQVSGIHWHMNLANEITFIAADEKRQNIPWVRMKDRNGNVVEYMTKDANLSEQQIEQASKRRMDCIDCHNRPTHIFLSPNKAVDQSLKASTLDTSLPYIKLKSVEVLSQPYKTEEEALNSIASGLNQYYQTTYPDIYSAKKASIDGAVKEVQRIYQTYFFPEMNTNWQSHPNNIGHYNAQGCFRCHDGQHFSREGKVIRNDCNVCHTTIDQTFGGKTITAQNGQFQHPINLGDKGNWQCAACHTGDKSFKHPLNLGDLSKFQCADCHKGQNFNRNF